jgi:hypothetical protein
MWKHIVCFIILIVLVTGCSSQHKGNMAKDSNKTRNDDIQYQRLSTRSTDTHRNQVNLSGQTQTVGTEINTAKKIMKSYKEYKLVSVSINGNNMWITAHTRKGMSPHERMKREAEINKKLKQSLPQYKMNVKLEEK